MGPRTSPRATSQKTWKGGTGRVRTEKVHFLWQWVSSGAQAAAVVAGLSRELALRDLEFVFDDCSRVSSEAIEFFFEGKQEVPARRHRGYSVPWLSKTGVATPVSELQLTRARADVLEPY